MVLQLALFGLLLAFVDCHDCNANLDQLDVETAEDEEAASVEVTMLQVRTELQPRANQSSRAPCAGDGTATQNAACKYNPSWSGCVYSPGCNWRGQSYFGGWCTGGSQCVYLPSNETCATPCAWQPATAAFNASEGEAEAAIVKAAVVAAAAEAAQKNRSCSGDGSTTENYACKYHIYWSTCVLTAGCNWQGQSALGGWCSGGLQCTYQPLAAICESTVGCQWNSATEALHMPS